MQVFLIQLDGSLERWVDITDITEILELVELSSLVVEEAHSTIANLCDLKPRFDIGCSAIIEEWVAQLFQVQARRFSGPRVRPSNSGLMGALRAIFHRKNHWRIINMP